MNLNQVGSAEKSSRAVSCLNNRYLSMMLATGLLMSCATNAVTVSTYHSQVQCIDGQQALAQFVNFDNVNKSALGMSLEPQQSVVQTDNLEDRYWFLKIAMGQKKSAGFGLALESEYVSIHGHKGKINLQWVEPSSEGFTAQVITTPCIYLQLEKGSYQQVEVVDQNNAVRFTVDTP
jgi:hypothetical protein